MSLKDIQTQFYKAIFIKNKVKLNLSFIASSDPVKKFNIYRNSIFETLRNSLEMTYPGIWALLGQSCANSVASAFYSQAENLPTSACLDDWGSHFPNFIASIPELHHLPYLKDYASYEWLLHLSYYAYDGTLFLYTSEFPIAKIQKIIENPQADEIVLDSKSTCYAIISRKFNFSPVQIFWITKTKYEAIIENKNYYDN